MTFQKFVLRLLPKARGTGWTVGELGEIAEQEPGAVSEGSFPRETAIELPELRMALTICLSSSVACPRYRQCGLHTENPINHGHKQCGS